jgi:hypothetical protein
MSQEECVVPIDIIRKFAIAVTQPIDPSLRIQLIEQVLKTLKPSISQVSQEDQYRLWKGFFYALWYTEMEKGGRQLMQLVTDQCSLSTLMAGFQLLDQDWFSIDHIRVDKYMAFVRLMLARLLRIQFKAIVLLEAGKCFSFNCITIVRMINSVLRPNQQWKQNELSCRTPN